MADPDGKQVPTIVRFYRFRNRLKEKTLGLSKGIGAISPETLAAAEAALEQMSEDYPDWVSGLIGKMTEQHSRCVDTPENRRDFFEEINHIAHDMKGQGGTFGYPLITDFSESLENFTSTRNDIDDRMVELVKAHIDAMRAVIKGRVKGDGGEIGKQLTISLQMAIERYKKS